MRVKSTVNAENQLRPVTTYQAGVIQASTHRILQKHCDEILKAYGISKMQWLIIGTIYDSGSEGIRITDLASIVGTSLSYLTNTINLLESKGILYRVQHSEDSRAKIVSIEPSFEDKCIEIEKYLRQKLRESIYANVTPEDFHIYLKVLGQLARVDDNPKPAR